MRILIADKFPGPYQDDLRSRYAVTVLGAGDDLRSAIAGHEILVVRSTKVGGEVIDAAADLALVVRAGAGYNTIDWRAAANRGIYVCNTPGKNAVAVAELTMGLITAVDRRIPDAVSDLRSGRWRKKEYGVARGLAGRTLGIIGFGDIGMEVARRAAAFDLRLVIEDRRRPVGQAAGPDRPARHHSRRPPVGPARGGGHRHHPRPRHHGDGGHGLHRVPLQDAAGGVPHQHLAGRHRG